MSASTDRTITPHPKPGKRKREWIKVYPDGREVLNLETQRGLAEYIDRKWKMADRQGWICCLSGHISNCPGGMAGVEFTFEHESGRGGGKRDDRISLPTGQIINGASHLYCNLAKGSRFIDFNGNGKRNLKGEESE